MNKELEIIRSLKEEQDMTSFKEKYNCKHLVGDLAYYYVNDYCPNCGAKISKRLKDEYEKEYRRLHKEL